MRFFSVKYLYAHNQYQFLYTQSIQPLLIFLHVVCHHQLASSKRLCDLANIYLHLLSVKAKSVWKFKSRVFLCVGTVQFYRVTASSSSYPGVTPKLPLHIFEISKKLREQQLKFPIYTLIINDVAVERTGRMLVYLRVSLICLTFSARFGS